MREIIIDRETDIETVIVSVKINSSFIKDKYFFDISETNENIENFINNDLTAKGYA